MGGTTLAMDRMHEGMTHRPSPAISPDAAAGTCTKQHHLSPCCMHLFASLQQTQLESHCDLVPCRLNTSWGPRF